MAFINKNPHATLDIHVSFFSIQEENEKKSIYHWQ